MATKKRGEKFVKVNKEPQAGLLAQISWFLDLISTSTERYSYKSVTF